MKILQKNIIRLLKHAKNAAGILFGIASVILLFVDKEALKIDSTQKGMFVLFVILLAAAIYGVFRVLTLNSVEIVKGKVYSRYADLWKIAFPRKSTSEKKIVVISVNTAYDTIVDDSVAGIDKPLVSPKTMHGQWIKKMIERGVPAQTIKQVIDESLSLQGTEASDTVDRAPKKRGATKTYPIGTVATYEVGSTIFYLLALSDFDENNNAHTSKDDLVSAITSLLDYYDKHGNGYDIYIPLLGTGQSRTGITKDESLEVLTSMCRLYSEKINGCAYVIVYNKEREEVAL